jgi:hypothetical protein
MINEYYLRLPEYLYPHDIEDNITFFKIKPISISCPSQLKDIYHSYKYLICKKIYTYQITDLNYSKYLASYKCKNSALFSYVYNQILETEGGDSSYPNYNNIFYPLKSVLDFKAKYKTFNFEFVIYEIIETINK